MEVQFSGNPKPFGIIGLVFAIFAALFSLVPCVGFYALIPAIIAFIMSLIAFLYARKTKASESVPLAGMIIAVVAIFIGIYQYYEYKAVFDTKAKIENAINEAKGEVEDQVKESIMDIIEEELEKVNQNDSIQQDSIQQDSIR